MSRRIRKLVLSHTLMEQFLKTVLSHLPSDVSIIGVHQDICMAMKETLWIYIESDEFRTLGECEDPTPIEIDKWSMGSNVKLASHLCKDCLAKPYLAVHCDLCQPSDSPLFVHMTLGEIEAYNSEVKRRDYGPN